MSKKTLQISESVIVLSNLPKVDTLPTSPMMHLTNQAINSFSINRPIKSNKNTKIGYIQHKTKATPNSWSVISENTSNKLTLTIDDIEKLKSNNKGLKKCFTFIMQKCNEQHYNPEIGFPLSELVKNGMYSNIESARKGIKDSIERIMILTFKGTTMRGKRIIEEQGGKLIYHYSIKNSYVTLSFNQNFNVEFIAQYFTIFPRYAFSLGNKAFSLLEYICYLARQHVKDITDKGSFNIGLKSIQDYLCLPSETETRKHKQFIIDPIENSIEEIENTNNNSDFTITPIYDPNYKSIKEWLSGYIKVEFKGEYSKTFEQIAKKTEKKLELLEKRKEKALTMIEAKKIEKSNKKDK